MMFRPLLILSLALTACASAPASTPVPNIKPYNTHGETISAEIIKKFTAWKTDFTARAIQKGYAPKLVRPLIKKARLNPKAISKDRNQPEFTRPIWKYVDSAASKIRVNSGREKLAKHEALFSDIEARYHVDRHILTAIWGLESAYGKIMGDFDIIDSFATFAFEGHRQSFGEAQMFAVLDILTDKSVHRKQLVGSWAGAVGMTQFIPATFRDYAVDYHGDGNKDLWADVGDALGSSANYLARHGWQSGQPVFTEITLPEGFDYALADGTMRSIASWQSMGVRGKNNQNWSKSALELDAKLLIPAGIKGPVFLTFKNFDVIKTYNNSTSYALGISVLAKNFQGEKVITTPWPRGDKLLSLTDKKNLQRALTRKGYDTGGVDGKIGPNSVRAIKAWQKANGRPVDGYVEQKLLAKILAK